MSKTSLEADYLIVGAGAMGMAFADEILTHDPTAQIIAIDNHSRPGGHWNDAYPHVRLHQPAAFYGVNSKYLGRGGAELASGVEVLAYYDDVLARFEASGRFRFFPMCRYGGEGRFRSVLDESVEYQVQVARKTVDATYMKVEVPSIRPPRYEIAEGVELVPPNALSSIGRPHQAYVIVGSGKTGIDAALFLLDQGIDPDRITWIMPGDAWFLNRDFIQPGRIADAEGVEQLTAYAAASSLDEVFLTIEATGRIMRLDPQIWPDRYRCATVDERELAQLRRIDRVIRMGHVERIKRESMILEEGRVETVVDTLHIDCTADGLAKRAVLPVFAGDTITLQTLIPCQQVFSAAVIGYVESKFAGDDRKNELSQVLPHPERPRDFLAMTLGSTENMRAWISAFPFWLRRSRLSLLHHDSLFRFIIQGIRSRKVFGPAIANLERLKEKEFAD